MHRFTIVPLLGAALSAQPPAGLTVCTSTPDLQSLVRAVVGAEDTVHSFVRPAQDPHHLEARPSMVRLLHDADALALVGLELEIGWLPLLLENARNGAVLHGQRGHVDTSAAVHRLGVRAGGDRSQGDIHPGGNPHYLLDPLCSLQVAELLRDRLAALRPDRKDALHRNCARFREQICAAMVGEELAALYGHDAARLSLLSERGELAAFLERQGDRDRLRGWYATMQPLRGSKVAADHDLWPYFARRFGIEVVAFLEPKPGIAPSTAHLQEVIATMRAQKARAILSVPVFPSQHAELVAGRTGARIAAMAHQTGARPGCEDYIATVDHNVRQLAAALGAER